MSLPLECPSCAAQIGELRSRQRSSQLGRKAQDCWEPCHPRCCRRSSSWPDCCNKVSTVDQRSCESGSRPRQHDVGDAWTNEGEIGREKFFAQSQPAIHPPPHHERFSCPSRQSGRTEGE